MPPQLGCPGGFQPPEIGAHRGRLPPWLAGPRKQAPATGAPTEELRVTPDRGPVAWNQPGPAQWAVFSSFRRCRRRLGLEPAEVPEAGPGPTTPGLDAPRPEPPRLAPGGHVCRGHRPMDRCRSAGALRHGSRAGIPPILQALPMVRPPEHLPGLRLPRADRATAARRTENPRAGRPWRTSSATWRTPSGTSAAARRSW